MPSTDIAISIRGLSKAYDISEGPAQFTTLGEAVMHRIRHPFHKSRAKSFLALDDISFDVHRGDVVGVIGRNGAGKSTLLKILSRITHPTAGKAELFGRVGSLLEVGTGFHPELTGRENIFLNGSILGMRRREILRRFDAIVDFSGVQRFLDTPVKRYSSGMYVRLAFAVAAHLDSDILIVDEVLAVGDSEFQRKCLGKMQDVATSGRTVLFVSHNMQSVSVLCNKAIFLADGRLRCDGPVQDAIDHYIKSFASPHSSPAHPDRRPGTGEYRFTSAKPSQSLFRSDEEKSIDFRIERRHAPVGQMYLSAHIVDSRGHTLAQCDSRLVGHWIHDAPVITGRFSFTTPWLKPGSYRVDLYLCSCGLIDINEGACTLNISPILPYAHPISDDGLHAGSILADFTWESAPASISPLAAAPSSSR